MGNCCAKNKKPKTKDSRDKNKTPSERVSYSSTNIYEAVPNDSLKSSNIDDINYQSRPIKQEVGDGFNEGGRRLPDIPILAEPLHTEGDIPVSGSLVVNANGPVMVLFFDQGQNVNKDPKVLELVKNNPSIVFLMADRKENGEAVNFLEVDQCPQFVGFYNRFVIGKANGQDDGEVNQLLATLNSKTRTNKEFQ